MDYSQRAGLPSLFAVCRTHYGTVLIERGEWSEAEAEFLGAGEQLALQPGQAAEEIARLGELRRRQGRFEEAARLFDRVALHPRAQIGHAAWRWIAVILERRLVGLSVSCARFLSRTARSAHPGSNCWPGAKRCA
jgi:tetratricopeptide (TPR) repeat protein